MAIHGMGVSKYCIGPFKGYLGPARRINNSFFKVRSRILIYKCIIDG